ncbi:MAG: prohibitin family protein [Bacilli bacterium]|nr:prohibitin family protein [Bacilli bacterium]
MKFNKFYFKPNNGYIMENDDMFDVFLSVICTAVLWIIGLIFIFGSWFTVAEGERAILTTFGKASNNIYEAGLHVKWPIIQDVKRFDVKTIRDDYKTETYTKDIQTARITVSYSYNLISNDIVETYKTYGNQWQERILYPNLEQAVKAEVGTWNADQMVANRDKVASNILTSLQARMIEHNYPVSITNFQMINIDYSDQFESAIEKKVVAEQAALEEANRTKQVEQKAKQQVTSAKAEAESMRIRANALANNPKLVNYEFVQKWDGKLPQIMTGDSMPILMNLNK